MPEDDKRDDLQTQGGAVQGPGTVISPGSAAEHPQETTLSIKHDQPAQPSAPAAPAEQAPAPPEQASSPVPPAEPQGGFFHPKPDDHSAEETDNSSMQPVDWQAAEFIAHDKS